MDFFWVSCVHWAQRFPSKNSIKTFSNNVFGNIFGQFWKFRSFCFFLKFFPSFDPPRCTGDFFLKQNYLKTGSKHVWTILGTVLDTLEILNFSIFSNLSLTRPSRVHCAKFLPKKLPRHMFKTCLIAFGNVFWAFWKIEGFSSFLEFFQVSTLQGALGNFFRKNHLKTSSKLVWTLLGKFLDTFEFSIFFRFFFEFFQVSTLEGALVNLFLPKKLPQSLFKTCLNYLGNVFGHFGKKWKFFHFSDVFPCFDPPGCTGQYFSPEKYLKTSSTLVWKLLRTFLDTFRNSIFFDFFFDFLQVLISKVHWSRKFRKKSAQNKFGHFWKCSSGFWKYEIFSVFLNFFDFSTLQGALGETFHRKKTSRHVENMFEHFWERIWAFWKNRKFSSFLKFFPVWTFQGALGSFFWENYLKTSSKLVWTLLRTFWTLLRNQFFFVFSSNFHKIRSPGCTGQENFGKNYLKQVWTLLERFFGILELWNLFDFCGFFLSLLCALGTAFSVEKLNQNILKQCFWEHFRTILKVSKFLFFLKFFPSFDPPRCTGDFFLKQNYLKTGSKHVWTILGTVLDTLEILNFSIFSNLSLTRPSRVHCAKFLPKKLPRHMFKTCLIAFGNVFWAFWKIEGFSSFLEFFQVSTLQGALGNFFRKNHLKTSSKLVWTLLGKFLDTFEFSIFFRFFFEFFQVSTLEGALVNLFLPKKLPRSMLKTCLNYLGNVFGHFGKKWKFFHFSDVFPCFDPPGCTGQYFSPEKYLKTSSTLVWKLLRTFLDTFRNSIFFDFFFNFLQVLISKVHWSRKFRKKSAQNKFGHFWKCSSGFWKYEIFSVFLNFFDFSTLQGALGETFHRKKTSRHVENMFEHFWERIWAFWKNRKFSSFLKFFPVWTFQGALGSFFWENYLKTSSKLIWTLLRTFWTLLRNQFFFVFSSNFHKIRSPGCTGQEKFGKNYLKQVWTLLERFFGILELWKLFEFCGFFLSFLCALGTAFSVEKLNQNILKQCFWEHFRTILKFSKFFLFLKFFPSLDPPRCTGDFFSKQNYLKTDSEHVWTLLGTVLDTLETMKFSIFSNLSLTRPSRVHCAKILPRKITSKHVQNMFDCFWERFLGILKNWKFSQFFGVFPSFDSPRCTGKFVLEKITSKQVQNLFGHF